MRSFDEILKEFEDFFAMDESSDSKVAGIKGRDIHREIEIDFMTSVTGSQQTIKFPRKEICDSCNGTRIKKGSPEVICQNCEGKGYTVEELGHTIA